MSYINLNTTGSFKTNESFIYDNNNAVMCFTARQPLVVELSISGVIFSNIKLETGEQISYKSGETCIRIHSVVIGRPPRIIYGEPSATADSSPLIRYQHHYDAEKFAVLASFSYKRGKLNSINFEIYKNDGRLKPGLMGKTISLKANKNTPLIKLLKEARKDGASAVCISGRGLEAHIPNIGFLLLPSNNEFLEVWASVVGAKRRMEESVLKACGITL